MNGENGLRAGMSELLQKYAEFDRNIQCLPTILEQMIVSEMEPLKDGIDQLTAQYEIFNSGIVDYMSAVSTIKEGYDSLYNGISKASKGTEALVSGSAELAKGNSELEAGARSLYSGIQTLQFGTSTLVSGGKKLSKGAKRASG
ncbi:MAG: hypothetical protein PUG54_03450, partial [Firmicutes bacterium]|nr:hypothetical protein [Bacillota bacterium]